MGRLNFKLEATASGSHARAGTFQTLHNEVQTPVFMPVGTQATVRGQRPEILEDLGFPVLLANTYHLMLRPGPEVFQKMGGIQRFMSWPRSVLTDSGGFQIFSLPNERQMTEEGAIFKSYVDNRKVLLTPERSIEVQKAIGSDIMMVLDQCICSTLDKPEAIAAMELTHRWAVRSFEARGDSPQSMFGIVQGACFPELRKQSADFLTQIPFDGFAIGGLAVGESKQMREEMTAFTAELLPKHLPRYLMGVGTPLDLLEAVHRGVDMFDCILPTALGQQGVAYTSRGKVDLRRGAYKFSDSRIDEDCVCPACTKHSISYLHHLIRVKESLGSQLIASHNLFFYARLMKEIRASILNDTFLSYYNTKREAFAGSDRNFPILKPKPKKSRVALTLGKYSVHETKSGVFSIRHIPSGEVMHSVNDPHEEARTLYVNQSRFLERIHEEKTEELVIWDVGLGSAINAMATVTAYENADPKRPVHIVSFENDLDSLRLALKHRNLFTHLRHPGPVTLLEKGSWSSKIQRLSWTLLEGDFFERLYDAPAPDIIYFDPFSYKTDTGAWTYSCFKKISDACKDRATELFTYSSSTAVRALLLANGFYVASGVGSGPRSETTVAFTPKAWHDKYKDKILKSDWLDRWERSSVKFPESLDPDSHPHFEKSIRSHEQFNYV